MAELAAGAYSKTLTIVREGPCVFTSGLVLFVDGFCPLLRASAVLVPLCCTCVTHAPPAPALNY